MSFSLNDAQLDERFDLMPALAGRPRRLEDLAGGLTNRNVKVTTPDGVYVARCCDTGVATCWASTASRSTSTPGPPSRPVSGRRSIDYRPSLGILLLGYLDGDDACPTPTSAGRGSCAKAATAMPHAAPGPRFRGDFDMFERQPRYLKTVQDNGFRIPERLPRPRRARSPGSGPRWRRRPDDGAVQQRSAGRQLHRGRRRDVAHRLRVLRQQRPVLRAGQHLERVRLDARPARGTGHRLLRPPTRRTRLARARLQGIVAKYGWTLWGCIQSASSALDFDFWGWAMERYDGAVAEFHGPDFARLLDDVGRDRLTERSHHGHQTPARPRAGRHRRRRRDRHQRRLPPDQARRHRRGAARAGPAVLGHHVARRRAGRSAAGVGER